VFKQTSLSLALAGIAATVLAVHEPRLEPEGEPPVYAVACPEGAADASACEVDQLTYDGWKTYKIECQQCHGGGGMGSTFAPNLMTRFNETGVDYGRFLYVIEHGYQGQMGVMPSLARNPRVQKNKDAVYAYLKARADGAMPNGRPPKPDDTPPQPQGAAAGAAATAADASATAPEAAAAVQATDTAPEVAGDADVAPNYAVSCPEGAGDAGACTVDQLTYDGWRTFKIECQQCHGGGGLGSTFAPNLLVRFNESGVDYARFLDVMENGFQGQVGVMPSMAKNPRVQKNKDAVYAYLKARADGVMPNGRPPKPGS